MLPAALTVVILVVVLMAGVAILAGQFRELDARIAGVVEDALALDREARAQSTLANGHLTVAINTERRRVDRLVMAVTDLRVAQGQPLHPPGGPI